MLILVLICSIFLVGCEGISDALLDPCGDGYGRKGIKCCIDVDNDSICDSNDDKIDRDIFKEMKEQEELAKEQEEEKKENNTEEDEEINGFAKGIENMPLNENNVANGLNETENITYVPEVNATAVGLNETPKGLQDKNNTGRSVVEQLINLQDDY